MCRYQNSIHSIHDMNVSLVESPEEVTKAFVEYYKGLLGTDSQYQIPVNVPLMQKEKVLNDSQKTSLCTPFCYNDIKKALWSIDGNKAPGYDGFSSQFFKDSWEVVEDDLCKAVSDFFANGKLL